MKRRNNGEGSIYFDKKRNRWRVTITLPNGKHKDFCSVDKNKAIKKKNEFIASGYHEEPKTNKTLGELADELVDLRFKLGFFGENTYRSNLEYCKRIQKSPLGHSKLTDITVGDINNYFSNMLKNYSKSSIKKDKATIKRTLNYAKELKLIDNNPMDSQFLQINFKSAKTGKIEALTSEEQKKLIEIITENEDELYPYSYLWLFMLLTGVRVGEACGLTIGDIDFKNQKIKIQRSITKDFMGIQQVGTSTKTNKTRTVAYSSAVEQLLEKVIKKRDTSCPYLFNINQDFIRPNTSCAKLRELNTEYNIAPRLTNHILRHTFATRLIEEGIPADVVQHQLGHSSVDITLDTYTSYFSDREQKYTKEIDQIWQKELNQA